MIRQIIPEWPATRTGKLIFTSTNQALKAALDYFDEPAFVAYLEKETKRLKRKTEKCLGSRTVNFDKACKLATRLQLNNEALHSAYLHRKAAATFEDWEVKKDGNCD